MTLVPRDFLKLSGFAALAPGIGSFSRAMAEAPARPETAPDHTLRIGTGLVELARDRIVSTTLYNGFSMGARKPMNTLREGHHQQLHMDFGFMALFRYA